MRENKVLQMFLFTCSILLMVLFTSCTKKDNTSGSLVDCCGGLGKLNMDGLVAYYPMDFLPDTFEAGTVIPDHSGSGNDGIFGIDTSETKNLLVAGKTGKAYATHRTEGILGEALYIASNDYIAILNSEINKDFEFGTGDFTWSLWVKQTEIDTLNNFTNMVWIGAQNDSAGCGGGTHVWLGIHAGSDRLLWQLRAVNKDNINSQIGYQHVALNSEGLKGDWHHIVAVKDGHENSDISIYVDGKEIDQYHAQEDATKDTISSDEKISMDKDYVFSKIDYFFIGKFPRCDGYNTSFTMDEVSIWDRALSEDEVEMIYKAQKPEL